MLFNQCVPRKHRLAERLGEDQIGARANGVVVGEQIEKSLGEQTRPMQTLHFKSSADFLRWLKLILAMMDQGKAFHC
jgi:aromatic ring-cleaving dioxygenase